MRTATTFRALLVAPSRHGPYLRRRSASVHLARVDVVVFIETKSLTAADDLRRRQLYRVLDDRVHAAARYVYSTTATNVKRIGPVDHSRAGVFLFNYFVADRQAQNIAVWHYMAGWFQQETRLDDGRHAVLCALGAATPLRRDDTLVEGVQHIVDAMIRYGTRRLVYLSFLGVREGRRQLSFIGRTVVAPLLLRNVAADHEAKERIIQQSAVDWVIVRPPRLTNGPRTGDYRHGVDIRATSVIPRISRADVADFMLRQIIDDRYVHRSPAVMY